MMNESKYEGKIPKLMASQSTALDERVIMVRGDIDSRKNLYLK